MEDPALLIARTNRYIKDHPGAHDKDLESLKDFMKNVAFGIDGMEGAKEGTV